MKNLKKKIIKKASAIGLAAALFLSLNHRYIAESGEQNKKHGSEAKEIISRRLSKVCIDDVLVFGNDPKKRDLYIIFQKHPSSRLNMAGEEKARFYSNTGVFKNQICVYRILEDLFKNRDLGLIVSEGAFHDDYEDIINKDQNYKNLHPEDVKIIEKGNNNAIINYVFLKDRPSSELIGILYPELYLTGFEDRSIKTSDEPFGYLETSKQRSENAIKYSLKHSEELYKKGILKNKDAAIVIGSKHFLDYEDNHKRAEKGETEYNLIYIFPKESLL